LIINVIKLLSKYWITFRLRKSILIDTFLSQYPVLEALRIACYSSSRQRDIRLIHENCQLWSATESKVSYTKVVNKRRESCDIFVIVRLLRQSANTPRRRRRLGSLSCPEIRSSNRWRCSIGGISLRGMRIIR